MVKHTTACYYWQNIHIFAFVFDVLPLVASKNRQITVFAAYDPPHSHRPERKLFYADDTCIRHRQVVVVVHSAYCLALIQCVGIMMLTPSHMVYFVNCGVLFFFSIVSPLGVSLSLS